jgi:hypothetical protein
MSSIAISLRKRPQLLRGLVLVCLFMIGADIACPKPCCDEIEQLADFTEMSSVSTGYTNTEAQPLYPQPVVKGDTGGQHSTPDHPLCPDDCFCCGRAVSNTHYTSILLETTTLQAVPNRTTLPSPYLQSAFHPPRFFLI